MADDVKPQNESTPDEHVMASSSSNVRVEDEIIHTPGVVKTSNSRQDAPTIYIDALQGVMVSPEGIKISFVEHFLEGSTVEGRYVLNLMMTFKQMKAIGELLTNTAEQAEVQFEKMANAKP